MSKAHQPVIAIAMISVMIMASGCVDLFSNQEVFVETSWYGKVIDETGRGCPNVTITLHVLNDRGEVYARDTNTSSAEPLMGMYVFDHIEVRDGAKYAYTTGLVKKDGREIALKGDVQPLVNESSKRSKVITVGGKNVTVTTYESSINEILIAGAN